MKKAKLNDLKVTSFITSEQKNIKGGAAYLTQYCVIYADSEICVAKDGVVVATFNGCPSRPC